MINHDKDTREIAITSPEMSRVSLKVNGEIHQLEVDTRITRKAASDRNQKRL
jgi:hypothetical protein